jgi:hypothetical protein
MTIVEVSAKRGTGMDDWMALLDERRAGRNAAAS